MLGRRGGEDVPMNSGRTVFAQLLDLLPRCAFDLAVDRYRGERRVRRFSCMDQLLCMVFAQLTGRSSLRETVSCLRALGPRRYHCGIRARGQEHFGPSQRATRLSHLHGHCGFDDRDGADQIAGRSRSPAAEAVRFAIDSTTIDLCLKLFPWAKFRRRKAGVKAHTMLDLAWEYPCLSGLPTQKSPIRNLDQITPQAGAFYVLDRGYVDFARLYRFHLAGAFFITRCKRGMDFGVRQRLAVARTDRSSEINSFVSAPEIQTALSDTLRRVRYVDPETGKRLTFLTNHLTLEALTIALLYRKRWKVELFFKWAKQHLHVKAFFGTTPNAVKTQLWVAVIVFVVCIG